MKFSNAEITRRADLVLEEREAEIGLAPAVEEAIARAYRDGAMAVEWQPIETAPKDGTRFLYAWRDPEDGEWTIAVGFWSRPSDDDVGPITHWMPLPAPPEMKH
jgi:hypothetical protein